MIDFPIQRRLGKLQIAPSGPILADCAFGLSNCAAHLRPANDPPDRLFTASSRTFCQAAPDRASPRRISREIRVRHFEQPPGLFNPAVPDRLSPRGSARRHLKCAAHVRPTNDPPDRLLTASSRIICRALPEPVATPPHLQSDNCHTICAQAVHGNHTP